MLCMVFREAEIERDKDAVEEEVEELEKELDLALVDTQPALTQFLRSTYKYTTCSLLM